MARIVLATIGSLGDLHPFIAIGRLLASQGEQVLLTVPEDGVAKVRAAGLDAAPILPSYATICERLGMSKEGVAARVLADPNFVIDEVLLPSLRTSTAALDELAADADVLVGSIFAFAAEIVAEKRRLPLATVMLQPMTLFSAWHPPTAPRFELMRHNPRTSLGRSWNRAFFSLARTMLRRRHAKRIDAVRAEHGLGSSEGAPMLDHGSATAVVLCCWSSALGPLPPDAPGNAALVGFPFFDSESGSEEVLAPELDAFLRGGDPPLIFTLGSFAVASAGRFYEEAAAASRTLGKRALMLTGQPGPPRLGGDCLFMNYAPHSAVFPQAAAVIHHGGIGTTGQALCAGRPQIVVPHFGDQFDNAARLQSAGIGLTVRRKQFERPLAARVISRVLSTPDMTNAAQRAARIIAGEDGAAGAAHRIASLCP
jgi:rhamnosyltransferase subunit B